MAYIEIIEPEDAGELLAQEYSKARKRAGRVFNILKIQSQSPQSLVSSVRQYLTIMYGDSPLSRTQREMLAVVVSNANGCHY